MDNFPQENKTDVKAVRHYGIVMAFAVVGILFIAGGYLFANYKGAVLKYVAPLTSDMVTEDPEKLVSLFPRSAPMHLRIAKLNIDADFVAPLGLNEDQTVSVPDSYEKVGWYMHGATPGEIGSAVILGHVDSYNGPAVFFSLGQLARGDEIEVTREDGTTAVFVVDELKRYSQDEFPTESVYGQIDHAGLRLVTCSGLFDRGAQKYSHNLVVYATLKENPKTDVITGD